MYKKEEQECKSNIQLDFFCSYFLKPNLLKGNITKLALPNIFRLVNAPNRRLSTDTLLLSPKTKYSLLATVAVKSSVGS